MMQAQQIVWIDGPVGRLQTIYIPAEGAGNGVAVINHPNPTQGGTFTNKVIQTAAKVLAGMGFHCYLPNLRGVGESEGEHDYGRGETADCLAVVEFARNRHPQAEQLVLSGFSFGGYVALFAALTCRPDVLLLMAPAVGKYEVPAPQAYSPAHTLLIHGAADDVVPLQNSLDWAEPQDMPVLVLPGAGHFFHGKLIVLRDQITRFFPEVLRKV